MYIKIISYTKILSIHLYFRTKYLSAKSKVLKVKVKH